MFSKASKYATKAVIYIWTQSLEDKKVGAKEIGARIDAPEAFIAKILQQLVRADLISSTKGPNGGFYVDDSHSKVTLRDVITVVDGDQLFKDCILGLPQCSEKNPCPIHFNVGKMRKELDHMLSCKSLKLLAVEVIRGETNLSSI